MSRPLTDKQKKLCDLLAQGKDEIDSYLQAGYKSAKPKYGVAAEIRKDRIRALVNELCVNEYGVEPRYETGSKHNTLSDDELEALLCKHAKTNAMAAGKLAELRLKRQNQGQGIDPVPLLLSPFLSESELDAIRDGDADVKVATRE